MKQAKFFLAVFCSLLYFTGLHAQATAEFEGVITYAHDVIATAKDYNVENDFEYIGKRSDFYYKKGNYKWLNQNAFMQMDMFRNKDSVEFLKMKPTDTVLYASNNFANEKVIDYKIIKNADTILGHVCDLLIINAVANGSTWTRHYYFSNDLPVDASLFANYKYNSTNTIYSLMKAIPLKIELVYPNRKLIYTAIKIEKRSIQDDLFQFAAGTKFKSLM